MAVFQHAQSLGRRAWARIDQRSRRLAGHVYEAGFQYGLWWNRHYISRIDRDSNLYWLACMVEAASGNASSQ